MRRAGRIFIAVLIGVVLGMLWVTDNALRAPPRFLPPLNADDVRCWAALLLQNRSLHRLYGIGQSLGGAILLQSLHTEPRFRAVVADSPFASFEEIAYDRLQQHFGVPKPVFWPMIRLGFVY